MTAPTVRRPLPNDTLEDGSGTRLKVIASVQFSDNGPNEFWTVLLMWPSAPFFQVATLELCDPWRVESQTERFFNIVPAVETYKEWGGDY